jgi:hypothetical protein
MHLNELYELMYCIMTNKGIMPTSTWFIVINPALKEIKLSSTRVGKVQK